MFYFIDIYKISVFVYYLLCFWYFLGYFSCMVLTFILFYFTNYSPPCFILVLTMQPRGDCCEHGKALMIIHTVRLALDADSCFSSKQLFQQTAFLQRKRLYASNLSWPQQSLANTNTVMMFSTGGRRSTSSLRAAG